MRRVFMFIIILGLISASVLALKSIPMDNKTYLFKTSTGDSVTLTGLSLSINAPLLPSSYSGYNYESIGLYKAYFMTNPTAGNSIYYTINGNNIYLQPLALNWNNNLSQVQQISMPVAVTGTVQDATITYKNVYGSGISLIYEAQASRLKELLRIDSYTSLPTPQAYIINGGSTQLELNFNLATNTRLFVEGVEWDKSTTTISYNDVIVKDAAGNQIYTITKPYALDADGNRQYGYIQLKKSGSKLYISIKGITYSWLSTAAYPVLVDPTFTAPYNVTNDSISFQLNSSNKMVKIQDLVKIRDYATDANGQNTQIKTIINIT